jgi:hypothetical protein
LAVALSFFRLLGPGCPKQAFPKIATPRIFFTILFTIRIRRRRYAAIATVKRQTIKHQFSHVQELIERLKQRPYAFWGLPALAFALHGWQRRNAAVKIESIDVAETIKTTKALIETEASLSLDLKEALDQLLYVTDNLTTHIPATLIYVPVL